MSTAPKETFIAALVTALTAALETAFPGKYTISRRTNFDPKSLPNHWIFVGVLEGAAVPVDDENWNVRAIFETPVLVSIRVACSDEDADLLAPEMNSAESVIYSALLGEALVAGLPSGYEVKGAQRDITKNELWTDIELNLRHPIV